MENCVLAFVQVFLAAQAPAAARGGFEDLDFDGAPELHELVAAVAAALAFIVAFVDGAARVQVEGHEAACALDLGAFGEVGEFLGEAHGVAARGDGVLVLCHYLWVCDA